MICRHCQHEQGEGRYCDACGMALSTYVPGASAPGSAREPEREPVKCGQCGVATTAPLCPGCGIPARPRVIW